MSKPVPAKIVGTGTMIVEWRDEGGRLVSREESMHPIVEAAHQDGFVVMGAKATVGFVGWIIRFLLGMVLGAGLLFLVLFLLMAFANHVGGK